MPGTKAASCSPVSAGANPEPSSADAMVPPVATKRDLLHERLPFPHAQNAASPKHALRRMAKCLDSKAPRPKASLRSRRPRRQSLSFVEYGFAQRALMLPRPTDVKDEQDNRPNCPKSRLDMERRRGGAPFHLPNCTKMPMCDLRNKTYDGSEEAAERRASCAYPASCGACMGLGDDEGELMAETVCRAAARP